MLPGPEEHIKPACPLQKVAIRGSAGLVMGHWPGQPRLLALPALLWQGLGAGKANMPGSSSQERCLTSPAPSICGGGGFLPAWWTFWCLPACGEWSTKPLEMAEQNDATLKADPPWFFGALWPKGCPHPCSSTDACAHQAAPPSAVVFTGPYQAGPSGPPGQALVVLGWVGAGEDTGRDTGVFGPPSAPSAQFFFLCSSSGKGHAGGGYAGAHNPAGLLMSTRSFNDPLMHRVALRCVFG